MNWEDFSKATMRVGRQKGTWEDLGTCFLAPIYSVDDLSIQFVITAYHVIVEAYIKQEQILILDPTGKLIPASVECYPSSSWQEGHDFVVLRLNGTTSVKPIPCSKDIYPGPVVIRGRPAGLETEFAFVTGHYHGLERRRSGSHEILDLTFPAFYSSRVPKNNVEEEVTPHDVWCGVSGSPIVLCKDDKAKEIRYVIGLLARLSSGGRAGRAYGVPISAIERACNSKNLLIDLEKPSKEEPEGSLEPLILSDLFSGMDDPDRERILWDWVSNLFYRGIESDKILFRILHSSSDDGLDICDKTVIHYFYGRILLKRGKIMYGIEELFKAQELANKASTAIKQRLPALVQGRLAVEDLSEDVNRRINKLLNALRSVEDIKGVSDHYIISELDSLLGRNATVLFLKADKFNEQSKLAIDKLVFDHERFLKNNPIQLAKQDVVSTMLKCLCLLWGVRSSNGIADELLQLSSTGFRQSERRKNSIFYTQMLCIKAIAYWLNNEFKKSLCLFALVGKILCLAKLTLNHEGISEVYFYLKNNLPRCAHILEMSFNVANIASIGDRIGALALTGISKQEAMEIEFKTTGWMDAVQEWKTLYKISDAYFET
jgi:hypothetical protein